MVNQTNSGDRLIANGSVLLKFVDGQWSTGDGDVLPDGHELLIVGLTRGLRCFTKDRYEDVREGPNGELPDPEVLNAEVPREQWTDDFNGGLKPPWQLAYVIYAVGLSVSADNYTYINATYGAKIAYERLRSRIHNHHLMFPGNWAALVTLDSRSMKTRFGVKRRPEFTVVDWRDIGGMPPLLSAPNGGGAVARIENKSKSEAAKSDKPASDDDLNDEIPWQ